MTGSSDVGNRPLIHFPGGQFGRCFETPLRLILRRPRSGRLEGEAQGLLSMRAELITRIP